MVVRNACSIGPNNHAQGSMVKGIRTMFFFVEFADDLTTVDDSCGGGGRLANTSKFAAFVALKIVVCIVSDFFRVSSVSG